mmetsp:Transcript_35414/g.101785  ORF Transcript_35414/g.101785 Transcript_35414/m.101785 type:complete len:298 (+) Transcript_35414:717-1610(+)
MVPDAHGTTNQASSVAGEGGGDEAGVGRITHVDPTTTLRDLVVPYGAVFQLCTCVFSEEEATPKDFGVIVSELRMEEHRASSAHHQRSAASFSSCIVNNGVVPEHWLSGILHKDTAALEFGHVVIKSAVCEGRLRSAHDANSATKHGDVPYEIASLKHRRTVVHHEGTATPPCLTIGDGQVLEDGTGLDDYCWASGLAVDGGRRTHPALDGYRARHECSEEEDTGPNDDGARWRCPLQGIVKARAGRGYAVPGVSAICLHLEERLIAARGKPEGQRRQQPPGEGRGEAPRGHGRRGP